MQVVRLLTSIIICEAAGLIGSVFTAPAIGTWYAGLNKPIFNPPNWLFAPVWTLLFLLMGVAAYLVYEKGWSAPGVPRALILFAVQLVFNILWSVLFFGMKLPFYAFIEIVILWGLILLNILEFYKISQPAGLILIPYLAWVSFAAALNLAIFRLNS